MSVFKRIFNLSDRNPMPTQASYIQFQNPDGTERVRMVPDTSAAALAARHSMSMIYGANKLPPEFGMRSVIEVKDPETGQFVPVTGNNRGVPSTDAQIASLQSYRESGIIGPQPINENGSNATNAGGTGTGGGSGGSGGGDGASADMAVEDVVGPRRPALEPVSPIDLDLPLIPPEGNPLIVPGSDLAVLDQTGPTNDRARVLANEAIGQAPTIGMNGNGPMQAYVPPGPNSPNVAMGGLITQPNVPERRPRQGIRASNTEGAVRIDPTRGANSGFATF